jgi:cell division protein FtsB
MGVFAKRGWLDWQRMTKQNDEMAAKVELARLRKEDLERQTDILRTDRVAQERVVRQYLGYIRPDEVIVEFP